MKKQLIRLHHTQARKIFLEGGEVAICPSNLCPGAPWHPEAWVSARQLEGMYKPEQGWTVIRNHFRWYNCTCRETGYYLSYWKEV